MACRSELVLAALGLGACLSTPEGLPRSWPPPFGEADVAALAAGDVDGDGSDDLVVVLAGAERDGAAVYLMLGGKDLDTTRRELAETFTQVAFIGGIDRPVAVTVVEADSDDAARDVVVFHDKGAESRLTVLHGRDLALVGTMEIDDTRTPAWLRGVPFGPGSHALFVASGPELHQTSYDELEETRPAMTRQPPPSGGWGGPQTVDGFVDGSSHYAIVAGTTQLWRTQVAGGPLTWTAVRTGNAWLSQVTADLDGDGVREVLGIDPTPPASLCAFDPLGLRSYACLPIDPGTQAVLELIADDLSGDERLEALVVVRGADSALLVHPGLRVDGAGALVSDAPLGPLPTLGEARAVVGNFSPGDPARQIIVTSPTGELECWRYDGVALAACWR